MFGAEISTYRELKVIAKVISSITSSAHSSRQGPGKARKIGKPENPGGGAQARPGKARGKPGRPEDRKIPGKGPTLLNGQN